MGGGGSACLIHWRLYTSIKEYDVIDISAFGSHLYNGPDILTISRENIRPLSLRGQHSLY